MSTHTQGIRIDLAEGLVSVHDVIRAIKGKKCNAVQEWRRIQQHGIPEGSWWPFRFNGRYIATKGGTVECVEAMLRIYKSDKPRGSRKQVLQFIQSPEFAVLEDMGVNKALLLLDSNEDNNNNNHHHEDKNKKKTNHCKRSTAATKRAKGVESRNRRYLLLDNI